MGKFILDEIGDIISIICFLIYLEVIQLNFCGLYHNCREKIIDREPFESFIDDDQHLTD